MRVILPEMQAAQREQTTGYRETSTSADCASDTGHFRKNKHIKMELHHVRDILRQDVMWTQCEDTSVMLASILIEPLSGPELKTDS